MIKCCCLFSVHLWKLVHSSVDGTEVLAFSHGSDAESFPSSIACKIMNHLQVKDDLDYLLPR